MTLLAVNGPSQSGNSFLEGSVMISKCLVLREAQSPSAKVAGFRLLSSRLSMRLPAASIASCACFTICFLSAKLVSKQKVFVFLWILYSCSIGSFDDSERRCQWMLAIAYILIGDMYMPVALLRALL